MNKVKEFEISRKIKSKDDIRPAAKELWGKIMHWVENNPVQVVGEPRTMVLTNEPPWFWAVVHVTYEE